MTRIYLDNNATSPLRPQAKEALCAALDVFGNPSSVHREGQKARHMLETARRQVADFLGVRAEQIVFTSSGTEANVMAICGLLAAKVGERFITSSVEHDCTLNTARYMQESGTPVTVLPVDKNGLIDLDMLEEALKKGDVALVAIMHANNETGVVQPIQKIAALCRTYGAYCHTDAVQTVGHIPVNFVDLGVHSLAFAGHKFGAPKGAGVLVLENNLPMTALLHGGAQEKNRRAGTENLPSIVGLGAVCDALPVLMEAEETQFKHLQKILEEGVVSMIPDAEIVGKNVARLAHCTQFVLPLLAAEDCVIAMDMAGVAISQGAACSSGRGEASHVLLAQGYEMDRANKAVRVSFGWKNTVQDIQTFLERLQKIAKS